MGSPSAATVNLPVKSRFFEGLPSAALDCILAAATPRQYLAGTIVTNQEDPANYYYILTRGRGRYFFSTQDGRKLILHWFGPGETFGDFTLLANPSNYLVSTETVKDSWVLRWDRRTIRSLAERFPRLLENELLTAADYLTLAVASHITLTCHDARQRLAQVLLNFARNFGEKVRNGTELEVTNEELASAANLTLFTTSRLLSEWQRQGAIVKSRGKVVLRSPERLFRTAA
jgi:CRP/FNR family transcriptional regulator, nitrogen oxide reductase regulator